MGVLRKVVPPLGKENATHMTSVEAKASNKIVLSLNVCQRLPLAP